MCRLSAGRSAEGVVSDAFMVPGQASGMTERRGIQPHPDEFRQWRTV